MPALNVKFHFVHCAQCWKLYPPQQYKQNFYQVLYVWFHRSGLPSRTTLPEVTLATECLWNQSVSNIKEHAWTLWTPGMCWLVFNTQHHSCQYFMNMLVVCRLGTNWSCLSDVTVLRLKSEGQTRWSGVSRLGVVSLFYSFQVTLHKLQRNTCPRNSSGSGQFNCAVLNTWLGQEWINKTAVLSVQTEGQNYI